MRKRMAALLLILTAGAAIVSWLSPFGDPRAPVGAQGGIVSRTEGEERMRAASAVEIPPRPTFGEARSDAFAPRQWAPAAPAAKHTPPPPAAPPMPYRYAGKVVHDGTEQLMLSKGDTVLPVRIGETLEGGYRVESFDSRWISLRHLPSGLLQLIAVDSVLDPEGSR